MMSYVLWAILAYLLYQFIFKLVIPVYTASRRIKKGFREMQEKMQQQQQSYNTQQGQQGFRPNTASSKPSSKPKAGDYIDFEEVK